jgi:hypothetical protein
MFRRTALVSLTLLVAALLSPAVSSAGDRPRYTGYLFAYFTGEETILSTPATRTTA